MWMNVVKYKQAWMNLWLRLTKMFLIVSSNSSKCIYTWNEKKRENSWKYQIFHICECSILPIDSLPVTWNFLKCKPKQKKTTTTEKQEKKCESIASRWANQHRNSIEITHCMYIFILQQCIEYCTVYYTQIYKIKRNHILKGVGFFLA